MELAALGPWRWPSAGAAFGQSASPRDQQKRMVLVDLHLARLRHVPNGRKDPRGGSPRRTRGSCRSRPRRLLQQPLAGHLLGRAVQPAADDVTTSSTPRPKKSPLRPLLHAYAHDRWRSSRSWPRPRVGRGGNSPGLDQEPGVGLDVALDSQADGLSGTTTIKVTSQSSRAERRNLLVCAVLREDGVVTDIPSGENRGKSLVTPSPRGRQNTSSSSSTVSRPQSSGFRSRSSRPGNPGFRLAVFVQDKRTVIVHQAVDLPGKRERREGVCHFEG